MSGFHGKFVWHELVTTDTAGALAFYGQVMGWQAQASGTPGSPYQILMQGSTPAGGMMPLPPEACAAGARPSWMGYIAVDDVDAYATRVAKAGGSVHRPAETIPGVGRFAVVADPQGAPFVLFKGDSAAPLAMPALNATGHVGWHELHANEPDSAWAFYAELFGWAKGDAVDMGAAGTYQLFSNGAEAVGGIMKRVYDVPIAFWLYYLNVDGIEPAIERVKAHGGQIINGPHEVPGGAWIAHGIDPQGAVFGLTGPKF